MPAYVPLTTNQTLLSVPGEDRPFPRELADDSSVLSGDNALDHWLRYLIGTRTRSDNRAWVMDLCADRTGRMTGGAFAAGIRGFQEFGWLLERDAARGSKDIVLRALFFNKEINAGHEVRLLFTVDDGRSAAYNEQSAEVEPITAASGADCD